MLGVVQSGTDNHGVSAATFLRWPMVSEKANSLSLFMRSSSMSGKG